MHPFLNTQSLTDEEIIEKLGKAHSYLAMQKSLGHTSAVESIKEVIASLDQERKNRTQKLIDEEVKRKNPIPNRSIDLGKIEE
jgi:hypothetical protein